MNRIAKLRAANVRDVNIAKLCNLTNSGLQRILRLQEYRDCEASVFEGSLSDLDRELAKDFQTMRKFYEPAVPAALRAMVDSVVQRRDLRTALAAAREILDRDPKRQFLRQETAVADSPSASLPEALIQAISKDSDGVAVAVAAKLKNLEKADA
jgi:predicted transcriptional regulator